MDIDCQNRKITINAIVVVWCDFWSMYYYHINVNITLSKILYGINLPEITLLNRQYRLKVGYLGTYYSLLYNLIKADKSCDEKVLDKFDWQLFLISLQHTYMLVYTMM